MRQYDAVEIISKAIISDNMAEAILLKGSLARGEEDEYSDVDFYVITSEENYNYFLTKRLEYLEKYQPILYYSKVNHVCEQIVCIYENGLHFDFYVTTFKELSNEGQILIIHDPNNKLQNYNPLDLSISAEEFGETVGSFCFTLNEFYASYMRKDLPFSYRLANHLLYDLSVLIRYKIDSNNAKLGFKGLIKKLNQDDKDKYLDIIKKLKIDSILDGVQMMVVFLNSFIYNLPIDVTSNINFDFYEYSRRLVLSIAR